MDKTDNENPELVKQHIEKNHKGDRKLAERPGQASSKDDKRTVDQEMEDHSLTPDSLRNTEHVNRNRKPDAEEVYRQGRQGPK